jgi:isopentenyl diphosphate isomerase/L-lactate dehydrogenase-like FMN-dependent dehydrogenase
VAFAEHQYSIYLAGLGGEKPNLPISFAELERRAEEAMTPEAWGYVAGAAGSEDTARANLEAFRKWRIVPRMLCDVSERDLTVELFGEDLSAPLLLAPIGVQSIVHEEAELAAARGAGEVGIPFVLSTAATRSIEEVAEVCGDNLRWFQLYWPVDKGLTESFVRRAESSGYKAIVVTLDTVLLAWRPRDLQNAFLPFLRGEGIAHYLSDPVFRSGLERTPEDDLQSAVLKWVQVFSDPSTTWARLEELRALTDLPILLKGILHPDDARAAVDAGVNGVIVSNHGGRQVDGAIGAFDALPGVVDAVPGDFPVLFDSGIRSGADAFKALAFGARAVLLGRPYIWGLALGGAEGVTHVLRAFLADLDLTFALSGCSSISDVSRERLVEVG